MLSDLFYKLWNAGVIGTGVWETVYMTGLSTLVAYGIGYAEAARMEAGQARVQGMENRAQADGTVTGRERARIEHAQDVQSARIHRQKHDRQHDLNHNGRVDRRRAH